MASEKELYSQAQELIDQLDASLNYNLKFDLFSLLRSNLNDKMKVAKDAAQNAPVDLSKLTRYLIADAITGEIIGKYEEGVITPVEEKSDNKVSDS